TGLSWSPPAVPVVDGLSPLSRRDAYRLRRIKKKNPLPVDGEGKTQVRSQLGAQGALGAAFSSSASAGLSALTYATYRLANDRSPRERATCTAPLVVPITSASSLSRSVP